ncbi:MAG: alpha/beta hydrolase fold domain-containing protein [Spongiibacteraceae bacterium]
MNLLKQHPKKMITLIIFLIAIAYSYTWTFTPHGRLDYRAALSLHTMSFTYNNFKPDPNIDFEIPLPINLIYSLSDLLPSEKVADTKDFKIPSSGFDIPVRAYWPQNTDRNQPLPVIVYFHGGGFVVGSVDIFDGLTRALANATKAIVVSVDYRLAPAHPYPAAVEDCYTATQWVADNIATLGGDPKKIAVAGDSAGGNLSAVVALKAREAGTPTIAAQIMYYPAVDLSETHYDSKDKFGDGYGLSKAAGKKFEQAYGANVSDRKDPYLSPLYAPSLAGLPPALIITAGFDPLTDASKAYAAKLESSGISVTALNYSDIVHGFMSVKLFPQRRDALNVTSVFLNSVFDKTAATKN